ncbi:MAG: hypothetical protein CMJ45_09025 [Planctomyces sp.]|nr:hypothetical protein [Planctomyces sp.]|tara:strand:- start:239 stop:466 length:228 start_codon:yes stop_codon:yes gene_type:complete
MPEGLLRGTQVRIKNGRYAKKAGIIDSNVYGAMVDFPGEVSMGYGVILDDDEWVMVRPSQVITKFRKSTDHTDDL